MRVKGLNGSVKSPYRITGFNFCFVSGPDTGRVQVTNLATCREYVNKNVMISLNRSLFSESELPKTDQIVDLSQLRLLIVTDPDDRDFDKFKNRLFSGKSALNTIESIAGWEKSKITTVKHDFYTNAWLITGPKEWMSQPQLLSVATWIIRLSADYGPLNTESYDALEASLYNIYVREHGKDSSKRGYGDSTSFVNKFWNRLYVMVKSHKDIFKDISTREAWECPVNTSDFAQQSGFMRFAENTITYSEKVKTASDKFIKLCEKTLPRKNKFLN